MASSDKSKYDYINNWKKENRAFIKLQMKKEDKEFIIKTAQDHGYTSTTKFIMDAIAEKISRM